ncbi:MAG: ABC transporter ATP-binding protein [Deltaproteobacteria bacterium]|nr:ABC transporter ATP-binding protein [Deltaproteobacteria bacterium]
MPDEPVVRMRGITKRFGTVVADDAIDLDLFQGEVHTLLGENGAGKSTLMHILAGMVQPDSGSIEIRQKPATIRSPYDALRLGIGMVYQHFSLVPELTVIENMVLGFEGGRILNWQREKNKLKHILEVFELSIPLDEKVSNLSVGQRQRVEIVKALFRRSEVLILDEPTSVLTPLECEELFKTICSLCRLGKTVVFITHKLKEALRVSDRISILKSGHKAAELDGRTLRRIGETQGHQRIFDIMFGSNEPPSISNRKKLLEAKPILVLEQVVCLGNLGEERLKKVSLTLKSGEIFGIAGVDGNGQKELAEVIAGQRKIFSGRLLLDGKDITRVQGAERMRLGISYITDDRIGEGCALTLSVAENAVLRFFNRQPFSRLKVLNRSSILAFTRGLIREFDIRVGDPDASASTLSGGSVQKLLLARELSRHPRVLVCNKPTHGLDAKTARYVQQRIQQQRDRGAAVLLISSDLDELLSCSDRIGVLFNGQLLDIVCGCDATHENIGKLMLGIKGGRSL